MLDEGSEYSGKDGLKFWFRDDQFVTENSSESEMPSFVAGPFF
jgi:hypothetical protein